MLNGHPWVVPNSGLAAAKSIKQTTFACVGVSDQGDGRGAIGRCAVGHTIDPLLGPFDANASGFDSSEAQSVPDDGEFDGIAHRGLSDHFDNFAGDQSHFEESGGDRIVSFDVENGPVLAFLQIIQSDRDHGRGLRAGSDLRLGKGEEVYGVRGWTRISAVEPNRRHIFLPSIARRQVSPGHSIRILQPQRMPSSSRRWRFFSSPQRSTTTPSVSGARNSTGTACVVG